MIYRGRVKNGVIALDDPAPIPEGASVEIHVLESEQNSGESTLADRLMKHAGVIKEGLPTDLARNHDHYLHGTPKR